MNRQIRQLGYVLILLFILLFAQLNNIQVLQASKLVNDPRNNRSAVKSFSEPRGAIQTADGVVIANSIPTDNAYKQLRQYPEGELFGQLTGFFSFNYGNDGLEKTYNDNLSGKTYALKSVKDLLTDRVRTNNLTITTTKALQQTAKEALGDRKGSVVALDPKTGAVLAMYSNPSYDPTPLAGHNFTDVDKARKSLLNDKSKPMLPRSYRETFPPGSTAKVITSAAAYERKPELTTKTYPQLSSLALPLTNKPLGNFGGEVCGGKLPELLRVSCNTGYGQMGLDLGAANLSSEAQDFGFNQTPPLDLPSVAKSVFPAAGSFKGRTPFLAYAAIGQGDMAATPLQMALVAAGIANDGVIIKPHLLKEIRDNHGEIVRSAKPEAWLQATSSETARALKDNMVEVVEKGTATSARIPGIQVAAKTGTAQTHDNLVDTWLISFAPANDPKIAVAVVVEDQPNKGESTGGVVAAPIAKKVMQAALGAR